jgi:hypothetical protein
LKITWIRVILTSNSNYYLETIDHISTLTRSVDAIKKVSIEIKGVMMDDESLVTDLDKGMVKS